MNAINTQTVNQYQPNSLSVYFFEQVLFQYQESRKVIVINKDDDLLQKVKRMFNINSKIILQKFNDTWGDWLDVHEDEIFDKDKIKVLNDGSQSTSNTQVFLYALYTLLLQPVFNGFNNFAKIL